MVSEENAKKTTLLLVRHCQAEGNLNATFQGWVDTDITENGKRQLELLSEKLKDNKIDAVYSSPLKRAVKTAEAVNKYHNHEIKLVDDLKEIGAGEWEGKDWVYIEENFSKEYETWKSEPDKFKAPNGESMIECYERGVTALDKIAKIHKGETVAVVTHGAMIRTLMCWANCIGLHEISTIDFCDNTGISTVIVDENGARELLKFNDSSHLPDELLRHARKN